MPISTKYFLKKDLELDMEERKNIKRAQTLY